MLKYYFACWNAKYPRLLNKYRQTKDNKEGRQNNVFPEHNDSCPVVGRGQSSLWNIPVSPVMRNPPARIEKGVFPFNNL